MERTWSEGGVCGLRPGDLPVNTETVHARVLHVTPVAKDTELHKTMNSPALILRRTGEREGERERGKEREGGRERGRGGGGEGREGEKERVFFHRGRMYGRNGK